MQALVNKTSYGYPKRAASGLDLNRLNLLVAMLERRTKLKLAEYDIYVNIVGGLKITEPAADLAVCLANWLFCRQRLAAQDQRGGVWRGGLSGEVRHAAHRQARDRGQQA